MHQWFKLKGYCNVFTWLMHIRGRHAVMVSPSSCYTYVPVKTSSDEIAGAVYGKCSNWPGWQHLESHSPTL